jgi:hypothetical protein
MSTQKPQLPSSLNKKRTKEHVLRVQGESPLKKRSEKIINIFLFMMVIAIMGLTFSAMLGNDPTSILVSNKELKD